MIQKDIETRQLVFINYLQELVNNYTQGNAWKVKAEYSTNDNDKRVIVVQEQSGEKQVFYGDVTPSNNYYEVNIFGLSIQECKNISLMFGNLIGENVIREYDGHKWQIMFQQWVNPQAIEYQDIRRVSYQSVLKCIINKIN